MTKSERIANFLARGLTAAQVCDIVGVTPGMISQLQKDERFTALVNDAKEELKTKPPTEDVLLTDKYNAMEHRLLNQMKEASASADLPAITAALRVVGERQEKRAMRLIAPSLLENKSVVINISLPAHALPEIHLNAQKEVVAIGSRTLAPMTSDGVRNLFASLKDESRTIEAA